MKQPKSIERILALLILSSILIILTLLGVGESQYSKFLIALVFSLNIFISLFIVNLKRIKLFSSICALSSVYYSVLLLLFRSIRELFPKPSLKGSDVVGFAQYFGYPLFFDYLLFFSLIFIPFVFYFLVKIKLKR